MKKLKYLLFLFTILLITDVKAASMNLPNPTRICIDIYGGSTQCSTSITNATWNNNTYFTNPNFRLGDYGSGGNIYSSYNFQWDNQEFCKDKTILIKGTIGGLFDFFGDNTNWNIKGYNNNSEMSCSFSPQNSSFMNFTCSGLGGGSMIFTVNQESFPSNKLYEIGFSRNVDVTCDVSNGDIISSNEQNTQDIINNQNTNTNTITQNQNTNTQNIINNQNQNTQDIINNQNQNTQQEIESQKVCKDVEYTVKMGDSSNTFGKYLTVNGTEGSSDSNNISPFFKITEGTTLLLSTKSYMNSTAYCFYNKNKELISCESWLLRTNITAVAPSNTEYIRTTVGGDAKVTIKGQYCGNGNQALNDSVNNLNDTLNSDTPPDTENQLNDLESDLISDTPITDLITLPISLLNSYITGFSGSCSSVNLGNLLGTDIIFPCINLEQRLGSNLWNTIDSLFSIFMIYNIAMLMIQAFEGFTSLRDDYEGLYQPRHADVGYQPKHGGGN